MNISDIESLLEDIKSGDKGNNLTMVILQCVTLGIVLIKPIFMYWIQAKYNADPPHESIRKFEARDPFINNEEEEMSELKVDEVSYSVKSDKITDV